MNLFNYTYLNANGYLKKFRDALGFKRMSIAYLTMILKMFDKKYKLKGFIVKDEKNNKTLYYKDTLNAILGVDRTGNIIIKPENNIYLNMLGNIVQYVEEKEAEKEQARKEQPEDNSIEDSDMEKVSAKLIHDDNYPTIDENKKMKKIFITESQLKFISQEIYKESVMGNKYIINPDKVKIVKNFLDKNFIKVSESTIGEDGYSTTIPYVALKGTNGKPMKKMTDKQLFIMLKDKFPKIYSNKEQRNKFLKIVLKKWYYNEITNNGIIKGSNFC